MNGLPFPIHPPSRAARTCPLGLRCVDAATGLTVTDDLTVFTRADAPATRRPDARLISAVPNRSGLQVFHGLPGLQVFEHDPADTRWETLAARRTFVIEVNDRQQRYLPCQFVVSAPTQGLASLADGGSPTWVDAGTIPLFSSAARVAPVGVAVLRAELQVAATGAAAGWALLEAAFSSQGETRIVRALADDQGRLALMFAYPEGPRRPGGISPPPGGSGLAGATWPVVLRFYYTAEDQPGPVADYAQCLSQAPAEARAVSSPAQPVTDVTLPFGTELNLGVIELYPA